MLAYLALDHQMFRLELPRRSGQGWIVNAFEKATAQQDALVQRFEALRESLTGWFQRRLGDRHEAEDLVQESFLRLAQRRDTGEVAHLDGYIYRTAGSVLTDRARRRAVRHADEHVELESTQEAANNVDPLRALTSRRALAEVGAVLDALPERTRTVFVLRRLEGLRHKEIALRLGISVSSVEKHVARAVDALADQAEAWR